MWRSVVRHGYPDTQRNQALIIASNVFLHIHPVKIKRYATKVTYTFCLGGLSFFMFLVLTVTGVLLMFYYVPATDQAYQNMKDIESSDAARASSTKRSRRSESRVTSWRRILRARSRPSTASLAR